MTLSVNHVFCLWMEQHWSDCGLGEIIPDERCVGVFEFLQKRVNGGVNVTNPKLNLVCD